MNGAPNCEMSNSEVYSVNQMRAYGTLYAKLYASGKAVDLDILTNPRVVYAVELTAHPLNN